MKFIVTDYWKCEWRCSEHYDIGKDGDGNVNNVLVVEPVTNVDEGDISGDIDQNIDGNINEAKGVEPIIAEDIFNNQKEDTNEDIKKVTEEPSAINLQIEEKNETLRKALKKLIFIKLHFESIS